MFVEVYRRLVALPRGDGQVYVSWQMLASDRPDGQYCLLRRKPWENWKTISDSIHDSTNYIDTTPEPGVYQYRVSVAGNDREISEAVTVDSSQPATNICMRFRLPVPSANCEKIVMGDLDNDGRMDFVMKYIESGRIWLMGIRGDGEEMWRLDTGLPGRGGWDGNPHHVPFLCWDVDGDGRTEVVYHHGGESWKEENSDYYDHSRPGELLVIADGETGQTKVSSPWPGVKPRVMMTAGQLKGIDQPASIVVLDETYRDVTVTSVHGVSGEQEWTVHQARPAGHNLDIADIDGDGLQEVIVGGVVYNGDGSIRWEAEPFGHTDMSKAANIDPDRPGLEIAYLVESHNPGFYLVDCLGKTIFKEAFKHAHFGWIAKHTAEHEGLQINAAEDHRKGVTEDSHNPVFTKDGSRWCNLSDAQSSSLMPIQWDDGPVTVFIHRKQKKIFSLTSNGDLLPVKGGELPADGRYGRNILLADVVGDFRENIVTYDENRDELIVIANPTLAETKKYSPMDSFHYRHDRSQHGSGYYMYVPPFEI